jgi:hypothetical protein
MASALKQIAAKPAIAHGAKSLGANVRHLSRRTASQHLPSSAIPKAMPDIIRYVTTGFSGRKTASHIEIAEVNINPTSTNVMSSISRSVGRFHSRATTRVPSQPAPYQNRNSRTRASAENSMMVK